MNLSSFSSLRARLVFLVLLALLPAFGMIYYEGRNARIYATAAGEEKALRLARNAVEEQRRLIADSRRFLGRLAQEQHWGLLHPTTCSALMAERLKLFPGYLNLGVINLKGDLLCSALPFKNTVNLADRSYFRRTVETKDFSVGEYQLGRVTTKATLNFGQPDFDAQGRLLAVLFAALDISAIEQAFVMSKRDEGTVLLMLDLNGTILSRHPDPGKWIGKPFSSPSVLKAVQAKQSEIKEQAFGQDGVERLYAFIALKSGGEVAGFVGIGIPTKVAFAEAQRTLINNLVLIGLVSAIILVTTWFGSDLLVLRPVRALVRATKRLGMGDLTARTGLPHRLDELGQLARSFDEMADSVQLLTRRNELILTSAGEGILGLDPEGKTTFVNPAAATMLGYRPEELIGQSIHILAHHSKPDGAPYAYEECPMYATISNGAIRHIDHEVFWRKDGTSVWVDYVSTPVRENGQILGAVITIKDLTERKRAEAEIQRTLQRIRALHEIDRAIVSLELQSVLDLLLEKMDLVLPYAATTVRLYNPRSGFLEPVACRNLDANEWMAQQWRAGRGLANVVFATNTPVIIGNAQVDPRVRDTEFYRKHKLTSYLGVPLIAKGESFGVLGFYTKEEHEFTAEEIEFVGTLAGQAAIAIHNARLFEEIKRQAGELAKTNKAKDEFLSVISHELKTPLNVIMGYTALIQDETLGKVAPEQRHALGKMAHESQNLLLMINSVLDVTLLEDPREPLAHDEVNIGSFLSEVKETCTIPTQKKLDIIWAHAPGLPAIEVDSKKLKHILQNLIHNAVKFTEEGRITVMTECPAKAVNGAVPQAHQLSARGLGFTNDAGCKWLEVKVADTGVGIPNDALPYIFDKFYQVDSSSTRDFGGMGLGLYVVKKFAERMGGSVQAESTVGKGSTFTVRLPVQICQ